MGGFAGHESYSRDETVTGSSDRSFGIVMATAFAVILLLGAWRLVGLILIEPSIPAQLPSDPLVIRPQGPSTESGPQNDAYRFPNRFL